jgi:hypothetical protein
VGGVWRGNEAKRNDLATRNPEPPTGGEAYTDLLYTVLLAHLPTASAMDGGGRYDDFLYNFTTNVLSYHTTKAFPKCFLHTILKTPFRKNLSCYF